MTAHDPAQPWLEQARPAHLVAAERLVRPLGWFSCVTIVLAVGLLLISGRLEPAWLASFGPPGLARLTGGSVTLSALGPVACLVVVLRRRRATTAPMTSAQRIPAWPSAVVTLLFAGMAATAVSGDLSVQVSGVDAVRSANGFFVASALLLLSTPWLLARRYLLTIAPEVLPEIGSLRALLFLPVFVLAAQAVLQIAGSMGLRDLRWARIGLDLILLLTCAELAVRAIGTWFLPPRDSVASRAPIGSFVADAMSGRAWSGGLAGAVRSQFGIDFSRSWALHFMRSAALPVGLLMLLFCWFLTGVTRIDLNQRGLYERLGVASAVLRPGLHLVLPWPFGIVRHQELGVIHAVLIGNGDPSSGSPNFGAPSDQATAEGLAPDGANRLWDSQQPYDVSYVIASGGENRQSFETVSASVSVLYRIGLSDPAAEAALYHVSDADTLVHSLAGRLLAHYMASDTLPGLLGENQRDIAGTIRRRLQAALDRLGSGIEIVAVTIEAIHPPGGAASAYRNVQAAEIEAANAIATEQGRAQSTKSLAVMNARNTTNLATVTAGEAVSGAQADLINLAADDRPFHAASAPFLLERYFTDIRSALENVPLEIIDHRLDGASLPTIDLRAPSALQDLPARVFKSQSEQKP